MIFLQGVSLDLAPNLSRHTVRQEKGYVVQAAAEAAQLPVDQGKIVVTFGAKERVVHSEIAVGKGSRPSRDVTDVIGNSRTVRFGQDAQFV